MKVDDVNNEGGHPEAPEHRFGSISVRDRYRAGAAVSLLAALLGAFLFMAPSASAHHPTISGTTACDTPGAGWTATFTSVSWQLTGGDDTGSANPHIDIYLRFRQGATGTATPWALVPWQPSYQYVAANGFQFSDTISVADLSNGDRIQFQARATAPWGNGSAGGQTTESELIPFPTNCAPVTTTTTTAAPTTVAPTTAPPTTEAPTTTVPPTTVVPTTVPPTTVPTTAPPTTEAPTTTVPPTTAPPTTEAPTATVPSTTVPPTTAPPTTEAPMATVPSTTVPPTTAPLTTAPPTTIATGPTTTTSTPEETTSTTSAPTTTTTCVETPSPSTAVPSTPVPTNPGQATTTVPMCSAGDITEPILQLSTSESTVRGATVLGETETNEPVTAGPNPAPSPAVTVGGVLPTTGVNTLGMVLLAAALLLGGFCMVQASRPTRRR